MKCEHDKAHDKLSFATLKHLAGVLDTQLQQQGVKSQSKREAICGRFLFQAACFLDNQWVESCVGRPPQSPAKRRRQGVWGHAGEVKAAGFETRMKAESENTPMS